MLPGLIAAFSIAFCMKAWNDTPTLLPLNRSALSKVHPAGKQPQRLSEREEAYMGLAVAYAEKASNPNLLAGLVPKGWHIREDIKQYIPDTLYEKINGRAEHYLAYDVINMTYVSFVDGTKGRRFFNLFVYDMGTLTRAFGVFSLEPLQDRPEVNLGRKGYRVEASYFFWKGAYYVQIISSEKGEDLQRIGMEIARTLAERIEDSGELVWGLTAFPEENRIPGTIQYFMRDALSLDFLKDTYTAQYRIGDKEVTAFLSRKDSPETAAKTLALYLDYLKDYGSIINRREADGVVMVTGDINGTFDVVFLQGRLIGGVTLVENRTLAEQRATELLKHLSGP